MTNFAKMPVLNPSLKLTVLASAIVCLSASATSQTTQGHSANFASATAHNRAAQEVLPTAEQKNDTYIPADANRQSIARENYRNNTVKEPASISTR